MTVLDGSSRALEARSTPPVPVSGDTRSHPVFTSDRAAATPLYGRDLADFLAEVALHKAVETPFTIGLLGPAGAGKSTLLNAILGSVATAKDTATSGRDQPDVVVARVGFTPGGSPDRAILLAVADALAASHPRLVEDCFHAGLDPETTARTLGDRLNEVRQSLDGERGRLDELSGRHSRILDSCLGESSGSSVDSYGRANRARIDRSLRSFGFSGGGADYRDLVRDASSRGSGASRWLSGLSAFWAHKGQTKLIVYAVILFAISWGLGFLIAHQDQLLDQLRATGDKAVPAADWLEAHAGWLEPLKTLAIVGALLALLANVVRAFRFLQPVMKGATLLEADVAARRRELDGLLAHQTRRVDTLSAEADRLGAEAAAADRRLDARRATRSAWSGQQRPAPTEQEAARAFFERLGTVMQARPGGEGDAPSRIVVGLDGLETLSGPDAAAAVEAAHGLLAQPGLVAIAALDREHLSAGVAQADPALAARHLERWIQLPIDLGADLDAPGGVGHLVGTLLGRSTDGSGDRDRKPGRAPGLDLPWQPTEGALLQALAPLAGSTPRAAKRLVNLYGVARADPRLVDAGAPERAALAIALALQNRGVPLDGARYGEADGPFAADLATAERAAADVLGRRIDPETLKRGAEIASRYRVRGRPHP